MTPIFDELQSQLDDLCSRRDRLADHLETVAARLIEHGERPPAQLSEDLAEYRRQFQTSASELDLLDEEQIDGPLADLSLDDLNRRLGWQRRVAAAIGVLDRVAAVRRADGREADELSAVRDDVDALKQRLTSWPDVKPQLVNELAHGTHPLCDLLRLAGDGDAQSDSDWNTAVENLRDMYGKALATSAARGRLCCDAVAGDE